VLKLKFFKLAIRNILISVIVLYGINLLAQKAEFGLFGIFPYMISATIGVALSYIYIVVLNGILGVKLRLFFNKGQNLFWILFIPYIVLFIVIPETSFFELGYIDNVVLSLSFSVHSLSLFMEIKKVVGSSSP